MILLYKLKINLESFSIAIFSSINSIKYQRRKEIVPSKVAKYFQVQVESLYFDVNLSYLYTSLNLIRSAISFEKQTSLLIITKHLFLCLYFHYDIYCLIFIVACLLNRKKIERMYIVFRFFYVFKKNTCLQHSFHACVLRFYTIQVGTSILMINL